MRLSKCGTLVESTGITDELTFQEWLLVYHDFNQDDIKNLLSSDELAELHEDYEEWLSQQ